MWIDILGTSYGVIKKNYSEDDVFYRDNCTGYCNMHEKQIVVCNLKTWPGMEKESIDTITSSEKETCRHEIVHAFLFESGLDESSNGVDSWATNEEMVDWFAKQGIKIFMAWKEAKAL